MNERDSTLADLESSSFFKSQSSPNSKNNSNSSDSPKGSSSLETSKTSNSQSSNSSSKNSSAETFDTTMNKDSAHVPQQLVNDLVMDCEVKVTASSPQKTGSTKKKRNSDLDKKKLKPKIISTPTNSPTKSQSVNNTCSPSLADVLETLPSNPARASPSSARRLLFPPTPTTPRETSVSPRNELMSTGMVNIFDMFKDMNNEASPSEPNLKELLETMTENQIESQKSANLLSLERSGDDFISRMNSYTQSLPTNPSSVQNLSCPSQPDLNESTVSSATISESVPHSSVLVHNASPEKEKERIAPEILEEQVPVVMSHSPPPEKYDLIHELINL